MAASKRFLNRLITGTKQSRRLHNAFTGLRTRGLFCTAKFSEIHLGYHSISNGIFTEKIPVVAYASPQRPFPRSYSTFGNKRAPYAEKLSERFRPKLIIFDKYGTIVDFHSTWTPWLTSFSDRLEKETGLSLRTQLFEELDVCKFTDKVRHGLFAQGTSSQIKTKVEEVLVQAGMTHSETRVTLDRHWSDRNMEHIKPVYPEIQQLFRLLKARGVKIVLSTSSDRDHTIRSMKKINLMPYIDRLICADEHRVDSVKTICTELGVNPSETVVVGDTEDDVKAGMTSEAGMTVGVLSGTGTRLDLAPYSNYIINSVADLLPLIFPQPNSEMEKHRPVVTRLDPKGHRKASLVIFDKDGTLLCFHSMWTSWLKQLIERLEEESGLELQHKVLTDLGYCTKTETWGPGLFAEGTVGQNQEMIIHHLKKGGLSQQNAEKALHTVWKDADHACDDSLKLLDNPTHLFRTLKQFGVKIAICTADSRVNTEQFIKKLGVSDCVDIIVCGDDNGAQPKPSPHNALKICDVLGVDPSEAIHVGDTIADIGMGVTARLGATVGVLSGVGDVQHLDTGGADHIIPSIKHVLSIALNEGSKQVQDAVVNHHRIIEDQNNKERARISARE